MANTDIHIVNLFGPPGAGKSTQAKLLMDRAGFVSIATGNILRNCTPGYTTDDQEGMRHFVSYYEQLAPYLSTYIEGGYIPDAVMIPILTGEINYHLANGNRKIVLAGSIKTKEQAEMFVGYIELLRQFHTCTLQVINYQVDDEIAVQRITSRDSEAVRPDSGIPQLRVDAYHQKASGVIQYFQGISVLTTVSANEGDIELIYERTTGVLDLDIEDHINNT